MTTKKTTSKKSTSKGAASKKGTTKKTAASHKPGIVAKTEKVVGKVATTATKALKGAAKSVAKATGIGQPTKKGSKKTSKK